MPEPTKVFISYSHDSDVHAALVLDLANTLRRDGIDAILDQYLHRGPEEGWPLWMDNNIGDANNFVLMVCTDAYLRRVTGKEKPGEGLGVRWEGKLIYKIASTTISPAARGSSRSCSPARSPHTFLPRSWGTTGTRSRASTAPTRAMMACIAIWWTNPG